MRWCRTQGIGEQDVRQRRCTGDSDNLRAAPTAPVARCRAGRCSSARAARRRFSAWGRCATRGTTRSCAPPGGQDESHLVSACIRCERCYEACPRRVIVPAHVEDGLLGMRTPALDFGLRLVRLLRRGQRGRAPVRRGVPDRGARPARGGDGRGHRPGAGRDRRAAVPGVSQHQLQVLLRRLPLRRHRAVNREQESLAARGGGIAATDAEPARACASP